MGSQCSLCRLMPFCGEWEPIVTLALRRSRFSS
uniref:Uncharacterized protein n=1 Tax=Anguilla anguilla TaxID=7936 RepID=A0A0E9RXX0_ANGAN